MKSCTHVSPSYQPVPTIWIVVFLVTTCCLVVDTKRLGGTNRLSHSKFNAVETSELTQQCNNACTCGSMRLQKIVLICVSLLEHCFRCGQRGLNKILLICVSLLEHCFRCGQRGLNKIVLICVSLFQLWPHEATENSVHSGGARGTTLRTL
jgi:hypothetical protein